MSDKDVAAQEIVKRYSLYAGGAGLIPVPVVDFAAIAAIEVKMLQELGNLYDVPFSQDKVRPIVAALIGGYTSTKVGYGVGGSMMKSVPVLGSVLGMISVPAFGAGLTWAIGRIFITHFASGGTFLDFDPSKVRDFFSKSKTEVAA
jgi:uncharacterized protein (DUF697 family)